MRDRSDVVQLRGGLDVAVVRRGGTAAVERAQNVYGCVRGVRSGGIAPSRKLKVGFVDRWTKSGSFACLDGIEVVSQVVTARNQIEAANAGILRIFTRANV